MTTVGEYRVGISFNPSANPTVDALKRAAAGLIDMMLADPERSDASGIKAKSYEFRRLCLAIEQPADIPERARLITLADQRIVDAMDGDFNEEAALAFIEEAAMWAVKAATKGPME